eukprot:361775-Chlamydomonas_euryale.AAC.7
MAEGWGRGHVLSASASCKAASAPRLPSAPHEDARSDSLELVCNSHHRVPNLPIQPQGSQLPHTTTGFQLPHTTTGFPTSPYNHRVPNFPIPYAAYQQPICPLALQVRRASAGVTRHNIMIWCGAPAQNTLVWGPCVS